MTLKIALDVQYTDGSARTAAVLFTNWTNLTTSRVWTHVFEGPVAEYVSLVASAMTKTKRPLWRIREDVSYQRKRPFGQALPR